MAETATIFTSEGYCKLVSTDPSLNKKFAVIERYAQNKIKNKKYDTMTCDDIVSDLLSQNHGFEEKFVAEEFVEEIFGNVAVNSLLDAIEEERELRRKKIDLLIEKESKG